MTRHLGCFLVCMNQESRLCSTASIPPQGGRKHPQQEFLQVDTTNILFICGGAFAGLDKIIDSRGKGSSIGFGAKVKSYKELISLFDKNFI